MDPSLSSILLLAHLLGLTMAVGAGAVKVMLLIKCYNDHSLIQAYFKLAKSITQMLIAGFILLTVTGIIWIFTGYPFTFALGVKSALVALVWILGPYIDNVAEPALVKLAPASGEQGSAEFVQMQKKHFALEIVAEGLFIAIIVMWVLFR
ncbi:MAG: hypothetical protein OEZ32_14460 [Nitrospinota bacterium]|nr:hypothetical protein [Nitrospinota bacterium]